MTCEQRQRQTEEWELHATCKSVEGKEKPGKTKYTRVLVISVTDMRKNCFFLWLKIDFISHYLWNLCEMRLQGATLNLYMRYSLDKSKNVKIK